MPDIAPCAVSALTAKAKLAGMWREKVDQHNTGSVQYERIERVIVEHTSDHAALSDDHNKNTNDWLAAIDKIEELNPRAVVVGHGPLDPDNSPRHIQQTRRYIQDFIRLKDETATAQELYDRMLALHPDRINPGSLWGSANAAKAARQPKA